LLTAKPCELINGFFTRLLKEKLIDSFVTFEYIIYCDYTLFILIETVIQIKHKEKVKSENKNEY